MSTVSLFDRNAQATNLLFVADWRKLGQSMGVTWRTAMRKFALTKGGAFCHKCDDTLLVLTVRDGKVAQRSYKPGTWKWDN